MKKITWNSPVILSFVLVSGAALLLNWASGGWANRYLFSVYSGSLLDPLFYVRLFGHVLGHASLSHYSGNMILILLIGPLLVRLDACSEVLDGRDLILRLDQLLRQRQKVEPLVGSPLERSVIQIEPIYVDGCTHHPCPRKSQGPFRGLVPVHQKWSGGV